MHSSSNTISASGDSQRSERDDVNVSIDILSVNNKVQNKHKRPKMEMAMGPDEEQTDMNADDSGEMPTTVPNFLVKTYEIVNVSPNIINQEIFLIY